MIRWSDVGDPLDSLEENPGSWAVVQSESRRDLTGDALADKPLEDKVPPLSEAERNACMAGAENLETGNAHHDVRVSIAGREEATSPFLISIMPLIAKLELPLSCAQWILDAFI